jgi:hypothetical protein
MSCGSCVCVCVSLKEDGDGIVRLTEGGSGVSGDGDA